ncbi:hypothetical protein AMTRI_Chr04g253500 [Amborella trichopoda]
MELQEMQELRSRANELLLREEWKDCIHVYSKYIALCDGKISNKAQDTSDQEDLKLKKSLCLALSNRAEARLRSRDFVSALQDCSRALQMDKTHLKTLVCKGKISLEIDHYSEASECFQKALTHQTCNNQDEVQKLLERSRRLETQSRTGVYDLSDWVLGKFRGKAPELAEYLGPIQVQRSYNSGGGRGLFLTKNVDTGTLLFVSKPTAMGRAILPESGDHESARLIMWKDFVEKVHECISKSEKIRKMVYSLAAGEEEENLVVPDMELFRPDSENPLHVEQETSIDMDRIMKILDVNSLTEDGLSVKKLGRLGEDSYGVGLWILASFINHSCNPNARRVHIGDRMLVHASREIRAGEEVRFSYFDVLLPLTKRREFCKNWGFLCECDRCRIEEGCIDEMLELEREYESGLDPGEVVVKVEELILKGRREKGWGKRERWFFRASFWEVYWRVLESERLMRKWGRIIPSPQSLVDDAIMIFGDERVLRMAKEELKKVGGEKGVRVCRGLYGKIMKKKQAMRALLELSLCDESEKKMKMGD